MNGDMLNKILIERSEVKDIKTGKKRYHVHAVQRLSGTMITVVLYKRIGKHKTKVMELQDFIKNFDQHDKPMREIFMSLMLQIVDNSSRNKDVEEFLKLNVIDIKHKGAQDADARYRETIYTFSDESVYNIKDCFITWHDPIIN